MSLPVKDEMAQKRQVLDILSASGAPLFAVLDAARTGRVLRLLQRADEEHQSLYEGPEAEGLSRVAPYLLSLPKGSETLERVVMEGWGQSWGVFLSCRLTFKELRRHLRRFLLVESEETGGQLYFRFYDPRVLRVFLPDWTPPQRSEFFGEIECFWMESKSGEIIHFPRARKQA